MQSKFNNKVKQSETIVIPRSQITHSPYNPRKISPEAYKALKANIKANGIIGGLVYNKQTGNLVSGHQRLSVADEVNKYNPDTNENDYDVKIEAIDVDDKKEKELNIFFNSKSVQGEMDYSKLALMIPDIDVDLAGLDSVDMSFVEIEMPSVEDIVIPSFEPQAEKREKAEQEKQEDNSVNNPATSVLKMEQEQMTDEEKKAHIKAIKEKVKEGAVYEGEPYFTVSFDSFENKAFFLERFAMDSDARFIKGEELAEKLDEIYES